MKPPEVKGFFPFDADDTVDNTQGLTMKYNMSTCKIHLDGLHDQVFKGTVDVGLHHFHLVNDTMLFDRMDKSCDVIYVHGNIYYSHLLLGPQFGKYSAYIRNAFPSPFYDISKIVFQPRDYLLKRVESIKEIFRSRSAHLPTTQRRWLSIHIRGIMTKWPERAFECANALLDRGEISNIFFATDSAPYQEMAYEMIHNSQHVLYTVQKEMEATIDLEIDSMDIRNSTRDIRMAVLEWYMIGEGDYCLSTSLDQSTFSKTSIARGNCILIDAQLGEKCYIPPVGSDNNKEWLLHLKKGNRGKLYEWMHLPHLGHETIWSTVYRDHEVIDLQCLSIEAQTPHLIW